MGGDGGRPPFGDAEVDPALFPSLRAVGSGIPARTNAAFLAAFRRLLDGSTLQSEVASLIKPFLNFCAQILLLLKEMILLVVQIILTLRAGDEIILVVLKLVSIQNTYDVYMG